MKKIVVFVALLLLPVAYAQLDWSITDLRCGNGVLDKYELCEKGLDDESRCKILGGKLTIAMACYDQHCTCVPKVNPVYCGNNRRDYNEMCDGTDADDKCPVLGEIMGNISLTCNEKTCGCDINETISSDYSPAVVQNLLNKSTVASKCGDKKVERDEDCDPPMTLCTTGSKKPGICTEKCKCVLPEMFGVEETVAPNVTQQNMTVNATSATDNVTVDTVTPVAEITPEEAPEEEKPGFFGRIWQWLVNLFS